MGKRQAKISKEVVGAFQTLLHNLSVGRNLKKSAAKQLEKAKKYAKYKSILKPLIDFGLAATLPIAGAGGAISQIGRLSGASFSTDVLYDKIFGDIFKMQADPSKIKAKGAVRYAKNIERRMQKDLRESISKKLEDRLMEAGISGASSWAMSELTGLGKSKEGTEVVTKADKVQNFQDAKSMGYKGDQASWEALNASGDVVDLDEIVSADTQSYKDAVDMGFKGTEDEWLSQTYSGEEVSLSKEYDSNIVTDADKLQNYKDVQNMGYKGSQAEWEALQASGKPISSDQFGTKAMTQGPPEAPWYHDKTKDFYNIFGWAPKSYYGYGGTLAGLLAMGAGKKPEEDKRA